MEENFSLTYDNILNLEQRIERLMSDIHDSDSPIDKDELLKELNSIMLNCIDIRSAFTDNYFPNSNSSMKKGLLELMQNKREANQNNFIK